MAETVFLVAVSIGLVVLLTYSVQKHKRWLEEESEKRIKQKETERRNGEILGAEWEQKVLSLIEKHKYALAQERRRLLDGDAYGNIKDKGWGVEEGAQAAGIFYFIHNVLRPNISSYDRGEQFFGKYVLKSFGIADTIFGWNAQLIMYAMRLIQGSLMMMSIQCLERTMRNIARVFFRKLDGKSRPLSPAVIKVLT
jgi:hypothetical protein